MKIHTSHRRRESHRIFVPAWLLVALLLTACSARQAPPPQAAVDIHKGDACAVCGMYIDAGPGPRAEAWVQGYKAPLKFGSTRDFFAYALDPENKARLEQLLVQDSARINWQHPSNAAQTFVDARTAWYVAWQPLRGLMGPTFASFAERQDAAAFVRTHGGELMRFSDVTPAMTSLLSDGCPAKGLPAFALAKTCVQGAGLRSAAGDEHPELLGHSQVVPHQIDPGKPTDSIPLPGGKAHEH